MRNKNTEKSRRIVTYGSEWKFSRSKKESKPKIMQSVFCSICKTERETEALPLRKNQLKILVTELAKRKYPSIKWTKRKNATFRRERALSSDSVAIRLTCDVTFQTRQLQPYATLSILRIIYK